MSAAVGELDVLQVALSAGRKYRLDASAVGMNAKAS